MGDGGAGKSFVGGFMGCLGVLAAIVAVVFLMIAWSASRRTPAPNATTEPIALESTWSKGVNGVGDVEFRGSIREGGEILISCSAGKVENVLFSRVRDLAGRPSGIYSMTMTPGGIGFNAIAGDDVWMVRTDREQEMVAAVVLRTPTSHIARGGGSWFSVTTPALGPLREDVRETCGV